MATLRDQLRARRATYLERVSVFDSLKCNEPSDIRPVAARGFLEGGDDISPECEAKGVKPERRRLPDYISNDDKAAAGSRLGPDGKSAPSGNGDWDTFLASRDVDGGYGGRVETNLYRITAQLVRATEYFQTGIVIPSQQVLDLQTEELPSSAETDGSVPKAWHVLLICGADEGRLRNSYSHLIDDAQPLITASGVDVTKALPDVVLGWLNKFHRLHGISAGQACPAGPDLPARIWNAECPCQRKPPDKDSNAPGKVGDPPPSLESAIVNSMDAAAAALLPSAQVIVDEFRSIDMSDLLIAQILIWLKERWDAIPPEYRTRIISPGFTPLRAPADPSAPSITNEDIELAAYFDQWHNVLDTLTSVRAVPQYFIALSQKSVGDVCAEIFQALWPDDASPAYDKSTLESSGIGRSDFLSAIDRAVAGNREDSPFRLVALLNSPEGYMRVLDAVGPAGEDGAGANGLARPTRTAISAAYWRDVIAPTTIGGILTMADTADFHIAQHLRFLGLFRPGGRYRTGKPENDKYETYISELIPEWVTRFISAALLRVKYWLDDPPTERPNGEEMTYWSENHQMLFASAEYILPSFFPDQTFAYVNQTASWHRDRALPRVRAWLEHRLQFGYSEMNSGVYYNQHLPGLFNLVDFSPDDEIRKKALIALDLLMFDVVRRVCQGSYVAASGRQYWAPKRSGWSISFLDTIELLTGAVGDVWGTGEESAVSFVTSSYIDEIPEALLAIGLDTASPRIDRSRTSINLDESKDYGIDPDSSSGIVFWWGNGAYFTDLTYRSSQSWSYRWGLRNRGPYDLQASGPFKLFFFIDWAIVRIVSAILNFYTSVVGLAVSVLRQQVFGEVLNYFTGVFSNLIPAGASAIGGSGFPLSLLNGALLAPQALRRLVDIALAALDAIIGTAVAILKDLKLLDKNDDRVRVAYPALEQEFRELAIKFNSGSVLERQHLYGWRSRDAMLTSLNDNHKGSTSFQCEPCIATLGLSVSVFTGKRPQTADEHNFGSNLAIGVKGYLTGVARYAYDPQVFFTSQFGVFGGESSPEFGALAIPFAAGALFGDDGPSYWFGNLSLPLVYQHENVAISIYSPSGVQKDLGPEETHAHWPFDDFDEIITDERSGGRWLFGRRDRRFPPRTPCEPGAGRPTVASPWAEGKRREEGGSGSGYIALFSARGMKTSPDPPYGHRELIADGHENIWITIVGDRATYHSFGEFHDDVLAATLSVDVNDLRCAITIPTPGSSKNGNNGKNLEVSWDDGAKIAGEKIETNGWPRFEWKRSDLQSAGESPSLYDVRVDDVLVTSKADPGKGKVDWDEKAWRIEVKVRAWEEKEENGKQKWVETAGVLFVEHDFSTGDKPKRDVSPEGIQVIHPLNKPSKTVTQTIAAALQTPRKTVTSMLGQSFRLARKQFHL